MEIKGYNYCPFCGIKLQSSQNKQIKYCGNCGKKLSKKIFDYWEKVQCVICHQYVWPDRFDTIECSYCGSKYHYKCGANWLNNYNTCPLCQNVFLKPKTNYIINKTSR